MSMCNQIVVTEEYFATHTLFFVLFKFIRSIFFLFFFSLSFLLFVICVRCLALVVHVSLLLLLSFSSSSYSYIHTYTLLWFVRSFVLYTISTRPLRVSSIEIMISKRQCIVQRGCLVHTKNRFWSPTTSIRAFVLLHSNLQRHSFFGENKIKQNANKTLDLRLENKTKLC